jgi:hypothetical protein
LGDRCGKSGHRKGTYLWKIRSSDRVTGFSTGFH